MLILENNMIPIEKAAELFQVDVEEIRNWVTDYKISTSRLGQTTLVSQNDISEVLEHNYKVSRHCGRFAEQRQIPEKEMSAILFQIHDLLFLFRSVKGISPILRAVINEMSLLIPKERTRNIFIDVTQKIPFATIAVKYGISHEAVRLQYNSALQTIKGRLGFLRGYRDILAENEIEIRKLKILNQNQQEKIEYLEELLGDVSEENVEVIQELPNNDIPIHIVELLSSPIGQVLHISTRIKNCLKAEDLQTVEELLRSINQGGLERLLSIRRIGKKSFGILKEELIKSEIIDKDGNSYLFEYFTVKPLPTSP